MHGMNRGMILARVKGVRGAWSPSSDRDGTRPLLQLLRDSPQVLM